MDDRDTKQSAGYFKEKAIIAWSSIKGDQVDKAIQKVTSHMLKAPKEKYLYLLIGVTFRRNGLESKNGKPICEYILHELEKRSHTHNWIIVLKTLVTLHRLMEEGSQDFLDCLLTNNNVFSFRLKNIAEDFDSSNQIHFIVDYMNYLEEKRQMQLLLGSQCTVEAVDFEEVLKHYSVEILLPLCIAMTRTVKAIGNIVFRDIIVNNFCTLEAHELLIRDGKRLIHILSKQTINALEKFEYLPMNEQSSWLEEYEMYSDAVDALRHFFDCMSASSHVFSEYIPSLKPLPESMIIHLREIIRLGDVKKEVCTLKSLNLNHEPNERHTLTNVSTQKKEDLRCKQCSIINEEEKCIEESQTDDDDDDEESQLQQAEWSEEEKEQLKERKEIRGKKTKLQEAIPDLILFQGTNKTNGDITTAVHSNEIKEEHKQKILETQSNIIADSKDKNKINLDELFEHTSEQIPSNNNYNNKWNVSEAFQTPLISQTFSGDSKSYELQLFNSTLGNIDFGNKEQWSSGAPCDYNNPTPHSLGNPENL